MASAPIGASPTVTQSVTQSLRLDELLQVLLTELTHQDPFKPVDNKDFMSQIAQFASLDTTQQLNDNILQLLALQALNQSVGLMGKTVSAVTQAGVVNGTVTAIELTNGAPRLTIDTGGGNIVRDIAIGQLQTVRDR